MKKKIMKSGLGQFVQVYNSQKEMHDVFMNDVNTMGKEFEKAARKFNVKCIYDQSVLGTILVNMLASLTAYVEQYDPHFLKGVEKDFKFYLESYREEVDKQLQ